MSDCYLGIDPGSTNAGYAFYFEDGSYLAYDAMDTATRKEHISKYKPKFAILEKVGTMSGQGISSAGKFMKSVGVWMGILETLDVPYQEVLPAKWAKIVGLNIPNTQGVSRQKRKQIQKDYKLDEARKRFPLADLKFKKNIDQAEALFMSLAAKIIFNK